MVRPTRAPSDTGLLGWILALAPLAGIAWYAAGTPSTVVVGAVLPALCYLGVLLWIAHALRVRVRPPTAIFALAWGAGVAAPVAGAANELLRAHLGTGGWPLTAGGAPVLEEAAKAGVLVVLAATW